MEHAAFALPDPAGQDVCVGRCVSACPVAPTDGTGVAKFYFHGKVHEKWPSICSIYTGCTDVFYDIFHDKNKIRILDLET